ncbi:hypothetical protein E4U19_008046 [Claviceps sp. Clav32 group G5]|nr:hypothetical protein E4U19_008046 [Claviceps sp. Clav32 group G5]
MFTGGDRDRIDKWVPQIADKCRRDDETFKIERDRIVMIVSYLNEKPANLVDSQYISLNSLFHSASPWARVS